ncbi:response regulator [Salsuginibacillus kocurii]|uniref:response regulator n=1 Tax=Salsuginibacillus kocurii TaxID=427078 RepID=UPI000369F704|nr:response regulator [Salsuginibacillus kocurii]
MDKSKSLIDILIIEDDELTADIYCDYIQNLKNFEVRYVANNGKQALNILEKYQPQLILLDVYLPDIHGIDLLWKIRTYYRAIDVILITAASDVEVVGEAIRGGAFSYIIKPVMMNRMYGTLQNYEAVVHQLDKQYYLRQEEVDNLFKSPNKPKMTNKDQNELPKGIDSFTLTRVKEKLPLIKEAVNAHDFAKVIGVSHSTARRYLEYLVSEQLVEVTVHYGTIGRPERKYYYKA